MEMEIEIVEDGGAAILSKTQKQKIRRLVRQVWVDEASFYDHLDWLLSQIHYPDDENQRYNHIEHDLRANNRLVLTFRRVRMETDAERREALRGKLRAAIATKKHAPANADPQEQMHQKLCQLLPREQQALLPKPAQVRANPDAYRPMLSALPHQNPVRQYLASFLE